jgi:hypothetical protein
VFKLEAAKKIQKGGPLIELYQIVFVGCCIDPGRYRRGIFIIHPAPGNSLDPFHPFNRLYCHTDYSQIIMLI